MKNIYLIDEKSNNECKFCERKKNVKQMNILLYWYEFLFRIINN